MEQGRFHGMNVRYAVGRQSFALAVALLVFSLLGRGDIPTIPSDLALVHRIENDIEKRSCTGSLRTWKRVYIADPTKRFIGIKYREAGKFGIKAGIYFDDPKPNTFIIDDTPVHMLIAKFDRDSSQLVIYLCGPNFGPSTATGAEAGAETFTVTAFSD